MSPKTDVWQGTLALMILRTLDMLGPLHGYGVARRIEQTSNQSLAINPDHAESHYLLATAFMHLRRFDRAARSFQSCLEIDPDHLEARYGQGVLLRRYGDADGARAVFADMLKRAPDHLKAQEQLSQLEREQ